MLRCCNSTKQTHERSGISAIDDCRGISKISSLTMDYQCRCFRLFDRNSELPHRVDRTLTVLARKETSYDAGTIGHSGKQNGTVRHALVTRHPDLCLNLWRPENVKLRHKEVLSRYPIAILF